MIRTDVIVIGSGAAGLLLALRCATQGQAVTLVTKGSVEESNTAWAQGGVAAAVDLEEDSPAAHLADTLAAGAGLCDESAAAVVAAEAPQRVDELLRLGVAFDLDLGGALNLTREAAHSRARVAHAADATGRAISANLASRALRHPNITILESATVVELIVDARGCRGAWLVVDGRFVAVLADSATALATGGSGRVYARTTNPPGATADGLGLALAAGAHLADLEFVQFHPTALSIAGAPALLVSEAARGEGAILVDGSGRRFCFDDDPRGELAPRDVVARAIERVLHQPGAGAWLDLRPIGSPQAVRARFPNIAAACARFGIDVGTMPVPVAPAAHYHMGGVRTDLWARTSVNALYAVGECACTGLHGANRLASNSLAECLVFASRAAEDINERSGEPAGLDLPASPAALVCAPERPAEIRTLMWQCAGLERSAAALRECVAALENWQTVRRPVERASIEARSVLFAAGYIAKSALIREESRGSHCRTDFPERDDARWRKHILWSAGGQSFEPVALVAP